MMHFGNGDKLNGFSRVHECNRQKDGRTDHDMATSTATGGTADASSNAG